MGLFFLRDPKIILHFLSKGYFTMQLEIHEPKNLGKIAKKEFARIKQELIKIGYQNIDSGILESYLESYEMFKTAQEKVREQGAVIAAKNGAPVINPWHTIMKQHQENIKKCMAELGFSAGSRKRLQIHLNDNAKDDADLFGAN